MGDRGQAFMGAEPLGMEAMGSGQAMGTASHGGHRSDLHGDCDPWGGTVTHWGQRSDLYEDCEPSGTEDGVLRGLRPTGDRTQGLRAFMGTMRHGVQSPGLHGDHNP